MIKLLIGGSPCTYWSIAQKNNRETTAEGLGWELFKNYLIAKEKFRPDFFLYENNKSAAQAIKDQIKHELGVCVCGEQLDIFNPHEDTGARYIEINSALVSAQNRQRFYVHNCGDVGQPVDRGILLKDILETGVVDRDKARTLLTSCGRETEREYFKKNQGQVVLEQLGTAERIPPYGNEDKSRPVNAKYGNNSGCGEGSLEGRMFNPNPKKQQVDLIAEPIKCLSEREMEYMVRDHQEQRWSFLNKPYEEDKSHCVVANFAKGVPYNICAEPINITDDGKSQTIKAQYAKNSIANFVTNSREITGSGYGATGVAEPINPVRVGTYPNESKNQDQDSQQYRVYSKDGKSVTLCGNGGGMGTKTGLYAIPYDGGPEMPIYEVRDGKITIKGKKYPIKLDDGYYIIRKLSVVECCRLQTMPDDYCGAVSKSQAYKGLGNGWTAEVIIHILNGALKDVPKDEEIVVLSMYDGIGTGRYVLDKMGFTNVKYYAYEIDRYAMQIAKSNYPDIVECGDAFQVREDGWDIFNYDARE